MSASRILSPSQGGSYDRPPSDGEGMESDEYSRHHYEYPDDDEDEEEETEEQIHQLAAVGDYTASTPGDLSFKKHDLFSILATRPDGWLLVENKRGERGLVPSNYMKVFGRYEEIGQETRSRPSAKVEYLGIYRVTADISDELDSSGQLPKGTRPSSLYKLQRDNPRLSIEYHILPKLSKSGIGFHDLYWNPEGNKLRKRKVRFNKLFELIRCESLQFDSGKLDVINPFVRFCLFDGTRILSNIHEIKAQYDKKKPGLWTFLGKLSLNHSCAELRSFFVRSNFATNDARLLVELGFSYLSANKDYGELTIGWSKLPLLNESGQIQLQENKLLMIPLTPGTPFDNAAFDSAVVEEVSLLKNLVGANKVPCIVFRVTSPSEDQLQLLDSGPDTLIWNSIFLDYLFWYRRYAGQVMVHDKIQQEGGTLVPDTFLASFPKAAADPDVMDVLNVLWTEHAKNIPRSHRSEERMTTAFADFFISAGFPLLQTVYTSNWAYMTNPALLEKKKADFREFVKIYRETKDAVTWLTTKPSAPLNMRQVFVDLSDVYAD